MADPSEIHRLLSSIVEPLWYRARYPDAAVSGLEPARHFAEIGLAERRDPNRWFDGAWYTRQYPDVAATGEHPLLHYIAKGAAMKRDPHPRFDAAWYVEEHPEAGSNPMLFHAHTGAARGWLTERPVAIAEYLPSNAVPFAAPDEVAVDIAIPIYRGLAETQTCLRSVLADPDRPPGRVIAIDDCSPDPTLRAWLRGLAKTGDIVLLRNKTNLGFVASANRGMAHAGRRDVVLLNSDTEVPPGWLRRLRAAAYSEPCIASVSPLSNNATICSYLGYEGAPIPAGMTLVGLDAACRAVNPGRMAAAPTTVGFCMYIRRAALDEVGPFDEQTFGKGYGEENDFCLRATAKGWRHGIACDVFVRHAGGVSFGGETDARIERAYAVLRGRYPDYPMAVYRHAQENRTGPWRFAVTMALFRDSGLPIVLLISHGLDGGVRRHIQDIVAAGFGRANYLLLEPANRGVRLSVPALPGHPDLVLAAERWRDVAAVARSAGVTRVHIHHALGLDLDARAVIRDLEVAFDVTVHDYFALCPQITLLPSPTSAYCGEPGPVGCDACIADRPSHGATDILSWRLTWAWLFREAERVFVPSLDTLRRLERYGLADRARLAPHEPSPAGPWPVVTPPRPGRKTRIAVLGVLAPHKGAHLVAAVAMAADPAALELHIVGPVPEPFPAPARARLKIAGAYRDDELQGLLARIRPHAIWFPAGWPETYSYTLSAAIAAGAPIVAPEIGAFPERLAGRPMTWIVPPSMDPDIYLEVFRAVTAALNARRAAIADIPVRPEVKAEDPIVAPALAGRGRGAGRVQAQARTIRAQTRTIVAVIPETFPDGSFTPCAHIRLLRPLDHPGAGAGLEAFVETPAGVAYLRADNVAYSRADAIPRLRGDTVPRKRGDNVTNLRADVVPRLRADNFPRLRADVIATQRYALPSVAAAEALAAHAKRIGAMLLYDLDDDLLNIPPDHPEAGTLAPKTAVVERMVRLADVVRVSTPALAARVEGLARRVRVVENALDERIWGLAPPRGQTGGDFGPVRVLCMGTATHDGDMAVVLPALEELHRVFPDRLQVDLVGFVSGLAVPDWIRRRAPGPHAARSYPGFVHWALAAGPWDIGLAPLADTPFNACKSALKSLDYAAMGLAVLASDTEAYRAALADGVAGLSIENTTEAWYAALSRAIRDPEHRRALAAGAARTLRERGTLAARADLWRASWT